jgi:hypothetical protein
MDLEFKFEIVTTDVFHKCVHECADLHVRCSHFAINIFVL